jgi:Tol biopolymer transport system component
MAGSFSLLMIAASSLGIRLSNQQLLYADNPGGFFLQDFQSRHIVRLKHRLEDIPLDFRWSPDGRHLVYNTIRNGFYEFFLYDLFTRQILILDINKVTSTLPSWSPDGQRLVYGSDIGGLCTLQIQDMQTQCLQNPPAGLASWSPDGRWIAYFGGIPAQLSILDVETGGEIVVMEDASQLTQTPLVWSPDSRSLIFQRPSLLQQASASEPANEPAVEQPVEAMLELKSQSELYLIEFAVTNSGILPTGTPTDITGSVISDSSFTLAQTWSPDGQLFAYTTFSLADRNFGQPPEYDLYLYYKTDHTTLQLTEDDTQELDPAWSPDSRWFAYLSSLNGHPTLVLRAADNDYAVVSSTPVNSYNLDWRP